MVDSYSVDQRFVMSRLEADEQASNAGQYSFRPEAYYLSIRRLFVEYYISAC